MDGDIVGQILNPRTLDPGLLPTTLLTEEQVRIMREYKKKVLIPLHLAEALYCKSCWESRLHDGCETHVTDGDVLIRCRCRMRFYKGTTL